MGGHELGGLAATGLGHALPEPGSLFRVEASLGGVEQAEVIGFAFMLAREGEHDAVLGADAEGSHDGHAGAIVHVANRDSGGEGA